ncbi:MAG: hypothetical protein LBS73_00910 [Campylobacteraceae bacterium]|jgi:hypothetical protein|nr:hypothetical protein [Campylobacteraceae bacterium]
MRVLFILLAAGAFLFGAEPKFGDYAAKIYKGNVTAPNITISEFDNPLEINFAGKYYINALSCSTDGGHGVEMCVIAKIFDLTSGKEIHGVMSDILNNDLYWYLNDYRALKFKPDSSLIGVSYYESDELYRTVYFEFKNGGFAEVARTEVYPDDVLKFIENYNECEHFGGEEPYDEARAKEIAQASEKYCGAANKAYKTLKSKYKNDVKTTNILANFYKNY